MQIIEDELWALIDPILPPAKLCIFRYPSRMPASDRAALTGILLMLRSGICWNELSNEMGYRGHSDPREPQLYCPTPASD